MADNSPLFEEATETGGYFFRQYPLVDNGTLVENEPKGKSIRKALCDRNGEIMVVMSTWRVSHCKSATYANRVLPLGSTRFEQAADSQHITRQDYS